MSRHRSLAAAAAAFLALLLVGCPGGGGSRATPQETLQTMSSAMREGNRDQFVACWKADANQKKLIEAFFDMGSGPMKLKEAITKTYGPDGWKKFTVASQAGDMTEMNPVDPEKIAKAKVDIKGDQATVTIPGQPNNMNMTKEGGSWLVDAKQIPQGMAPEQAAHMAGAMKKACDKVIAEVGKSGQTPESLATKMQMEMMAAMQPPGGLPMPGQK